MVQFPPSPKQATKYYNFRPSKSNLLNLNSFIFFISWTKNQAALSLMNLHKLSLKMPL